MTPSTLSSSVSSSGVDALAVLSRSASSLAAAARAVNPTFDATLGRAMSDRTDPSKVALPKAGPSDEEATQASHNTQSDAAKADATQADEAKTEEASRLKKGQTERTRHKKPPGEDAATAQADKSAASDLHAKADGKGSVGAVDQANQKQGPARPKGVDPQGTEGVGPVGVPEQAAPISSSVAVGADQGAGQDMSQAPLSPEELLAKLAALGIGGPPPPEGQRMPDGTDAGIRTTAAILPSAGLAVLAESMMRAGSGDRTSGGTAEINPVETISSVGDGAAGLRVATNGKGDPVSGSGAPLSPNSPQFADELMDRVGRMRVLSRGGATEQMRVTLHPEDLGSIDLRLRVDAQNQVHLLITTDSDATRDLLNRQMPQLKEALARQEMGFGDVTVQVGDQQPDNQAAAQWGFAGERGAQEGGMGRGANPVVPDPSTVKGSDEKGRTLISATDGVSIIV